MKLLDAALFNAVIDNADAHAKNFSLLQTGDETKLAPLSDLLSTAAYPDLSTRFAMKIANRRTLEQLRASDWAVFADEIGIGAPFVRRRAREFAEAALDQAGPCADALGMPDARRAFAQTCAAMIRARDAASDNGALTRRLRRVRKL